MCNGRAVAKGRLDPRRYGTGTTRLAGCAIAIAFDAARAREASDRRARRPLTRTDVMTAREVAELLSLPVSTVYEFARRGVLPCARLGRTIRFVRDEIEAVLHRSGASRGDL